MISFLPLVLFGLAAVLVIGSVDYSFAVEVTKIKATFEYKDPDTPTGLFTTSGDTQISLIWTDPIITGDYVITDYIIEYSDDAGTTWNVFVDGTSTATSATITGLTNGQSYDFRVSAINIVGTSVPSTIATAIPAAIPSTIPSTTPDAPTGLSAISGNTEVSLSWTAPSDTGGTPITDYKVEYSTDGTTWTTFNDGISTATSTIVTGLTNGQSYSFRVSAISATSTSASSAIVTSTSVSEIGKGITITNIIATDDFVSPIITLIGLSSVTIEVNSVYSDEGATASDYTDGDLTSSIVTVSTVSANTIGSYTVTYDVTDSSSNSAVQVVRTVNVIDITLPVITLTGASTLTINQGDSFSDPGATCLDGKDGDIIVISSGIVNTSNVGTTQINYTCTDNDGNKSELDRTVIVKVKPKTGGSSGEITPPTTPPPKRGGGSSGEITPPTTPPPKRGGGSSGEITPPTTPPPKRGGGSSGETTPPSFTTAFESGTQTIFIGTTGIAPGDTLNYKLDTPVIIKTGQTLPISLTLYENLSWEKISHVALCMNKQVSTNMICDSNTHINWNKGTSGLEIIDPVNIISNATLTITEIDANKATFVFNITFDGVMETSEIQIYAWDDTRNALTYTIENALTVIQGPTTSTSTDTTTTKSSGGSSGETTPPSIAKNTSKDTKTSNGGAGHTKVNDSPTKTENTKPQTDDTPVYTGSQQGTDMKHDSPRTQQSLGVSIHEIKCNNDLSLYIRNMQTPICLTPDTFEKLVSNGLDLTTPKM